MSAVPRTPGGTHPAEELPIQFTELLSSQGLEPGPRCCCTMYLASNIGFALFIIGCIGASGAFPGSAIGWTTVGLGGGSAAIMLSLGNLKKRKIELIQLSLITAAYVIVGALGGMGVLSATQVGGGIIGICLASLPLTCCIMPQIKHRLEET